MFLQEPDISKVLEFLYLAEGGEVSHYDVLEAICGNFNKKAITTVKSILKEKKTPFNISKWQNHQFLNIEVNQLARAEYIYTLKSRTQSLLWS